MTGNPHRSSLWLQIVGKIRLELGIQVDVFTRPVEAEEALPFEDDQTHASYDTETIHRFWRALVHVNRVFTNIRARFIGKASPVHFFWGAFDLAVKRCPGRTGGATLPRNAG